MNPLVSQWVLPPTTVNELVVMYGAAETLLKDTTATHEVLRQAVRHYSRHLEQVGVFRTNVSQYFVAVAENLNFAEIKALLHRINCQVIQVLALKHICNNPCCCSCPLAYDDIACLKPAFDFIDRAYANPHSSN